MEPPFFVDEVEASVEVSVTASDGSAVVALDGQVHNRPSARSTFFQLGSSSLTSSQYLVLAVSVVIAPNAFQAFLSRVYNQG